MSRRQSDYALTAVRRFLGTVMWAPDEQLDAMTLILALTHVTYISPNVCNVLATGPKEAGKSTLTKNIPLLFAEEPFIVDRMTSSDAVRNVFLTRNPPRAMLFDDASKIWGQGGRSNTTNIQTQIAVSAYEDTGKVSVSRSGNTVNAPAYAVCFFNGLGEVIPDDAASRCIVFPTTAKPAGVRKRGARAPVVIREAEPLKEELHRWATSHADVMAAWLTDNGDNIHAKLDSRLLQLWGPLFAIAHAAGGQWPGKCMNAFLTVGLDASEKPVPQRDEQALLDTAKIITEYGVSVIFAAELIPALRQLPGSDFYAKAPNDYLFEDLLPRALGASQELRGKTFDGSIRIGEGWRAAPVLEEAAGLHAELYPEPAPAGPSRTQRAMTLRRA